MNDDNGGSRGVQPVRDFDDSARVELGPPGADGQIGVGVIDEDRRFVGEVEFDARADSARSLGVRVVKTSGSWNEYLSQTVSLTTTMQTFTMTFTVNDTVDPTTNFEFVRVFEEFEQNHYAGWDLKIFVREYVFLYVSHFGSNKLPNLQFQLRSPDPSSNLASV